MNDFEADLEGDRLLAAIDFNKTCQSDPNELGITESQHVSVPLLFPDFPYSNPYPQQLALMRTLYRAAEDSHCAIFESPTGTGKSLSLLTGSLRWLLDYNERQLRRLNTLTEQMRQLNATDGHIENDWIIAYEQVRLQKRNLIPEIEELTQLDTCLDTIQRLKATMPMQLRSLSKACSEEQQRKTILDNNRTALLQRQEQPDSNLENPAPIPPDEDAFLTEMDDSVAANEGNETEVENSQEERQSNTLIRIIYSSRTHSQLAQCLDELAKCPTLSSQTTVLQLSSRKVLCTNPKIYSLGHGDMINEACLELTQRSGRGCPMRNTVNVKRLSDYLLSGASSTQIANAVRERRLTSLFGKQFQTLNSDQVIASRIGCPYYATRKSMALAQLLLIPYSTLLLPAARKASGLELKNAVLIIDEAHNLLEATTASLSVLLSLNDMHYSLSAFCAYQERYRTRLAVMTALRLRQLIQMLRRLKLLVAPSGRTTIKRNDETVVTVGQMLSQAGVDNLSMHELVAFLHQRHFIHKLAGFAKWMATKQLMQEAKADEDQLSVQSSRHVPSGMSSLLAGMKRKREEERQYTDQTETASLLPGEPGAISTSLFKLHAFLEALVTCEDDARVVIRPVNVTRSDKSDTIASPSGSLYFTVLDPGRYLQDLVKQARCVFLAGGTMKPLEEFIEQVFVAAGKPMSEVVSFTCDHVIDPERQLAVFPVDSGEDGMQLEFTYQQRSVPAVMDACGEITLQVCQRAPGGVVVFLPSYEYQNQLCSRWESTGLWDRLARSKRVFQEPRKAVNLNEVMQAYSKAISDVQSGALLICVIGGKLSEGINFSNELARAVIIVGMPYPNPHCPLLREKMAYLDRQFGHRPTYKSISPGRQHYEALCMRAINQAIGRAVRHAKDYAAVFLLDRRFIRSTVQQKLPDWVRRSLHQTLGPNTLTIPIGQALEKLSAFYVSAKMFTTQN